MSARFDTFTLRTPQQAILPANQSIVVDHQNGTLTLVDWNAQQFIEMIDTLTNEQFSLFLLLVSAWPHFVPYEQALTQIGILLSDIDRADFTTIRTTPMGTDPYNQARKRIDTLLTPVRALLSPIRQKIQHIGIDLIAILDTGYVLIWHTTHP